MIKILKAFSKKIILSFLILYGLNVITSSINVFIPINIITLFIVSLLGIPGLLALISIFFLVN